jgi:hypothetical protein
LLVERPEAFDLAIESGGFATDVDRESFGCDPFQRLDATASSGKIVSSFVSRSVRPRQWSSEEARARACKRRASKKGGRIYIISLFDMD